MKYSKRTNNKDVYTTAELKRPRMNLSKPNTREEKLYCWHFWLNAIQDPAKTRYILDNLSEIPIFASGWGNSPSVASDKANLYKSKNNNI